MLRSKSLGFWAWAVPPVSPLCRRHRQPYRGGTGKSLVAQGFWGNCATCVAFWATLCARGVYPPLYILYITLYKFSDTGDTGRPKPLRHKGLRRLSPVSPPTQPLTQATQGIYANVLRLCRKTVKSCVGWLETVVLQGFTSVAQTPTQATQVA